MKIGVIIFLILISNPKAFPQQWESLGEGINASIRNIYVDTVDNLLYMGGRFKFADGVETNGITVWDGEQFYSLDNGMTFCNSNNCANLAVPLCRFNNEMYYGIGQHGVGSIEEANGIASWDGEKWHDVGGGLKDLDGTRGFGGAALVFQDELYVAGIFEVAGQDTTRGVAKWDGENWHSINFPAQLNDGYVAAYSMALFNEEIYVGGNMYFNFENQLIHDIIKYDGENWHKVANGELQGGDGDISCMAVYSGELYVGGLIYGTTANPYGRGILKLDGDKWVNVGGGINSFIPQVHDMFVHDDKLFVVGSFSYVGGIYADRIASWDGENWCGLGSEFDDRLITGESYMGELCVGGGFDTIDGLNYNRLAKWTDGDFVDTCGAIVTTINESININEGLINVYPNPASNFITLDYDNFQSFNELNIQIYNTLGQMVYYGDMTQRIQDFDISFLISGIYWVKLSNNQNEFSITESFCIQN